MSEQSKPKGQPPDGSSQVELAVERTRLAYDRNMMSWIRTSSSLITFGFAVDQFFAVAQRQAVAHGHLLSPHRFAIFLICLGLVSLLLSTLQHRASLAGLIARYGGEAPPRTPAGIVAALIAVLGTGTLIVSLMKL